MLENIKSTNKKEVVAALPLSNGHLMHEISQKHAVEFKFPEYHVPSIENLDFSSVDNNNKIKIFVGNLIEFLKSPKVIYKNIEKHEERRNFRDKLKLEYPNGADDILTKDKMKLNKFSAFPMYVDMILQEPILDTHPELVSILKSFPKKNDVEKYGGKSLVEKEFMVSEFENAAINLIKVFEQKAL